MDDIFNLADKIKINILNGTFSSLENNRKVNLQESKKDVEYNLSETRLYELENRYGDVTRASTFPVEEYQENQNRWNFAFNSEKEFITYGGYELITKINQKYGNHSYSYSDMFHYPPCGYCGWHTNSDVSGKRMYLVWAEEDNKSFFRYRDLDTGKIITEWEKRGWQVHRFEPPIWHCVGSYTNRVSIGFINR